MNKRKGEENASGDPNLPPLPDSLTSCLAHLAAQSCDYLLGRRSLHLIDSADHQSTLPLFFLLVSFVFFFASFFPR